MTHLLVEIKALKHETYQFLSLDMEARQALITAITKAVGESPRPKVAEPSVAGIISARSLGQCVVIKAANQKLNVRAQDVPALLEALNNANAVLNVPSYTETDLSVITVMAYQPSEAVES